MEKKKINSLLSIFESVKLPNYIDSKKRSDVGKDNDFMYEMRRLFLQEKLDKLSLPEAMCKLHEQQIDIGFIQDDLSLVKTFQCRSDEGVFLGQFNPRRENRYKGAGRKLIPQGAETKNAIDLSCFLCSDNVRLQQRGIQLYYQYTINDRIYNFLCNPFPFMPVHLTIATEQHDAQSWHDYDLYSSKTNKIRVIVEDLFDISKMLPGFVGFYNGLGAGATIEKHLHYQFFKVPSGHPKLFPLQQAAIQTKISSGLSANQSVKCLRLKTQSYPLTAFNLCGDKREIIDNIVHLIKEWDKLSGDSASANIIALWEEVNNVETISMYLVPRNKFFSRSPGLSGTVGGLEVLGEFIFCSKMENKAINQQKVNYFYLKQILQAVEPPKANML